MLFTRIRIPAEDIAAAIARDRALTRRMAAANLSPRHARKAWQRIQAHRWRLVILKEMERLIDDMRFYAGRQ